MTATESTTPERRRAVVMGFDEAHEVELLAAVLGGKDADVKAMALLHEFGGLLGVQRASVQRLQRVPGVGPSGAAAIRAAFELSRRAAMLDAPFGRKLASPSDVAEFLRAAIGGSSQETFLVLGLDVHGRLQVVRTIAIGSIDCVSAQPREVFRPLLEAGMHAVILVHNHPSGDPEPSDKDISFTKRMVEAGRLLGVQVFDHLVVTRQRFTSMAELGYLEPRSLEPRH